MRSRDTKLLRALQFFNITSRSVNSDLPITHSVLTISEFYRRNHQSRQQEQLKHYMSGEIKDPLFCTGSGMPYCVMEKI